MSLSRQSTYLPTLRVAGLSLLLDRSIDRLRDCSLFAAGRYTGGCFVLPVGTYTLNQSISSLSKNQTTPASLLLSLLADFGLCLHRWSGQGPREDHRGYSLMATQLQAGCRIRSHLRRDAPSMLPSRGGDSAPLWSTLAPRCRKQGRETGDEEPRLSTVEQVVQSRKLRARTRRLLRERTSSRERLTGRGASLGEMLRSSPFGPSPVCRGFGGDGSPKAFATCLALARPVRPGNSEFSPGARAMRHRSTSKTQGARSNF